MQLARREPLQRPSGVSRPGGGGRADANGRGVPIPDPGGRAPLPAAGARDGVGGNTPAYPLAQAGAAHRGQPRPRCVESE
eukprot:scaffold8005_cov118-Isochrysis_galbana.AAC.26